MDDPPKNLPRIWAPFCQFLGGPRKNDPRKLATKTQVLISPSGRKLVFFFEERKLRMRLVMTSLGVFLGVF